MYAVGIVDMKAAATVVGIEVCTAAVGITAVLGMVYRRTDCLVFIAGFSVGPHMQAAVVVVRVHAAAAVAVDVGNAAPVALRLSTPLTPFLIPTPFVANVTSVALGTSGCVRTDDFYNRRNLIVCPHVEIVNYIVLAGSS